MKKTLLAVALISAITSSAVMADTTLFGRVHASIDAVDIGEASNNVSHSDNISMLGVKGSEKISDNLDAVYHVEFAISGGDGSNIGNRDQYVGLRSNAGTLLVGKKSTPFKGVWAKSDMFVGELGSQRPLTGGTQKGAGLGTNGTWNARPDNSIIYMLPKMGGFKAAIAHSTEQNNNGKTATSASAYYTMGALTTGAGYEKTGSGDEGYRVMAAYTAGKFKVSGFIQDTKSDISGGKETDVWNVSGSVKTSAKGLVKAQYTDLDDSTSGIDDGATMWAVGYDHHLSKRTKVYAQYASVDNDSEGFVGLGGHGHSEASNPTTAGRNVNGISLGLKHSF